MADRTYSKAVDAPITVQDEGDKFSFWTRVIGTVQATISEVVNAVLGAGENHIGQVGGMTTLTSVTPVMATAGAYASGDAVGTKMGFANALRIVGGTGVLKSVKVSDKAKQNATLDLILFRSDPTASVTDNQPFDPNDADIVDIVAAVQISTWYSFNDNSYGQAECAIGIASDSRDLFGVLVSRGTPTYANGDLQVTIDILPD